MREVEVLTHLQRCRHQWFSSSERKHSFKSCTEPTGERPSLQACSSFTRRFAPYLRFGSRSSECDSLLIIVSCPRPSIRSSYITLSFLQRGMHGFLQCG